MTKNFKFLVGAALAFVFAFSAVNAEAAYTHTGLLKMGMTSSQVESLQETLNAGGFLVSTTGAGSPGMESMYFGAKTKAAVMAFQSAKGLGADGIVGVNTGTALAAMTGGSVTYPAGCSSSTGYSTTTGQPCTATANTSLPAGCSSTAGYSSTTGAKCSDGTTSSNTGALSGGAADINVSATSTDVEDEAREGEEDVAVLGFEIEADGGDVAVTSVRVTFQAEDTDDSDRFDRYVDEVSIWLGDKKVGSADAEDFSRDTSATPDTYTETITLSNAVVREDDEEKFYVAVSVVETIDTDELDARFNVDLEVIRFTDSTGAILTSEIDTGDVDSIFGFEDITADDELSLESSSDNPEDSTVKVEEDESSEEILALVATLENDEDSSDATFYEIPVSIRVQQSSTVTTNIEEIIESVMVEIGGEEYEADLTGSSTIDSDDSRTYSVDVDGDFELAAGDEADVKVWITFNDQEDNYISAATTVTASINPASIDVEGEDDDMTVEGSTKTGAALSLSISAAIVDGFEWEVNSTGSIIDFFFTVEAEDEDFDVLASSISDVLVASSTATVTDTAGTPETAADGVLSRFSGDSVDAIGSTGFTVNSGDTTTFRVRYAIAGTNGTTAEINITSAAGQEVPDDEERSPTATRNVQ
ncbi:MAG TPA: peptidoglycan-binding protein [Candidatus Paceibacterota bacterium]